MTIWMWPNKRSFFFSPDNAPLNKDPEDPINVIVKKAMETERPGHGDSSYSRRKDSEINAEELSLMSSDPDAKYSNN